MDRGESLGIDFDATRDESGWIIRRLVAILWESLWWWWWFDNNSVVMTPPPVLCNDDGGRGNCAVVDDVVVIEVSGHKIEFKSVSDLVVGTTTAVLLLPCRHW